MLPDKGWILGSGYSANSMILPSPDIAFISMPPCLSPEAKTTREEVGGADCK